MKRIQLIFKITILILLFGVSSCNDIDLSLKSTKPNIQNPNYFLMQGILTNVYNQMIEDNLMYGEGMWGNVNGIDNDELFHSSITSTDVNVIGYHGSGLSSSTNNFLTLWKDLWIQVEDCNIIINTTPSLTDTDEVTKNDLIGQARALRAYNLFLAARMYGPVPLKLVPTLNMTVYQLNRTPVDSIFLYAVKELRAAAPSVQPITTKGTTGWLTKSAIEALSMRVGIHLASMSQDPQYNSIPRFQQYQQYYDSVAVWGKALIQSGVHSLNTAPLTVTTVTPNQVVPAYARLFVRNMQNITTWGGDDKEGMWDAVFYCKSALNGPYSTSNSYGNLAIDRLGSYIGVTNLETNATYGSSRVGYCNGFYRPQQTLYNKYLAVGDTLRRNWNITTFCYKEATTYSRYPYFVVSGMPASTGNNPAKFDFVVYNDHLGTQGIITNPGTYNSSQTPVTITVNAYNETWVASGTPAFVNTTGAKFKVTFTNGSVSSVQLTGTGTYTTTADSIKNWGGSGFLSVYNRGAGKWRREYETNLTNPREQSVTSSNFPIIRYADVLLMTAEAALFANQATPNVATVADGLSYLQAIRSRAGISAPLNSYDLSYIQDERAREFCYEGLRRFDMLRWGEAFVRSTAAQVKQDVQNYATQYVYTGTATVGSGNVSVVSGTSYQKPYCSIGLWVDNYPKYTLLAIPAVELSRSANTFYQNPGW